MRSLVKLLLYFQCSHILATNSTDDWSTVTHSNIYNNLDKCARDCVGNANKMIFDVQANTTCQSFGCVCSESTQGQNFLNGLAKVKDCATKNCNEANSIGRATEAFQDLCLVHALFNSTQLAHSSNSSARITALGYSNLTDCAKFVLNGCLDDYGRRTEPHCGPRITKASNVQTWAGLANDIGCANDATGTCLCRGPNFDATASAALDAGRQFCGMYPSTQALPNPEADDMIKIIAIHCVSCDYPPRNFTYGYFGLPAGSAPTSGLPSDGRVQIGLSVAALGVSLFAVLISSNCMRLMKGKVPDATSESSTPSPTKEKLPDAIAEGSRLSPIKGKGKVLALPLETTGLMHERPAAHHQSGPEHPHRSEAGPDAIRKDRRNSQG